MVKQTKKEFLLAKRSTAEIVRLPSDEHPEYDIIIDYIDKHYADDDIVGCIIPENYKLVAVLIHDDKKNSRNDKWDFIIFNISSGMGEVETITLDNMDSLESMKEDGKEKFEVIKVISGFFEEIIQESVGVIRKYKGNGQ